MSSLSLADQDEQFPHARMYEIDSSKKSELINAEASSMPDNPQMKLLVLINENDCYDYPDFPQEKWKVPVIMVTASTGKNMKKHICQEGVENRVLDLSLCPIEQPMCTSLEHAIEGK